MVYTNKKGRWIKIDANFVRERITQLRLHKKVSEYKMSYDLGQSRSYIQSISSGRALPSLGMLLEICDYFGITPEEFFHEESLQDPLDPDWISGLMGDLREMADSDRELISLLAHRLRQRPENAKSTAEVMLSNFAEPAAAER